MLKDMIVYVQPHEGENEMNKCLKAKMTAVLLVLLLFLSGCARTNTVVNFETGSEETVSITFFGNKNEPENVTVIEEIISAFMAENQDIRVSYESLKGTDYYDALKKRIAAGKSDDVFMVNHDVVLELEETGKLADLSGLSTISSYNDEMLSQMREDGGIFWVPTTVSVFGLYCNTDLLKAHHQSVPETLSEWEEVCNSFVKQGITPIVANNDISLKTLAIGKGYYDVYQEGQQAELFERINSGKEKLSTSLTPGFTLVEEFIEKGYVDAETALTTKKTSDDLLEFVKGESPFMLTGAWAAGRVEAMEPDFEFEVVPYPILEDGAMVVANPDTRLSVNADSEHLDAAMRFVEYFTQAENIQRFADQQSSLSPLKGGAPSSEEEIQSLVGCYRSGRVVIGTDNLLELPIWDLTAEATKMLLSGDSVKTAMDWMDQQTRE